MAEPLTPPASPVLGRFTLRHVVVVLIAASAMVVMLMTSRQMSDLRYAVPPLSQALSWLDRAPVPMDMYHVVLFALIALAARLLLPRLRWWWLLLGVLGLALVTELLQFWTVGREPSLVDARDDAVGAVIGLLLGSVPLWFAGQATHLLRWTVFLTLAGIALLPFQQWPITSAFGFPVLPSDAMFMLALAVRGFALATSNAALRITGFHGWLVAYVVAAWLAVMVAPQPYAGAIGKWVGMVYLALIAALVCDLASRRGFAIRMAVTWLVAACAVSVISIVAVVGYYGDRDATWLQPLLNYYGSLPPGNFPRVRTAFNYASMFANFILVAVCLAVGLRREGKIGLRTFVALLLVLGFGVVPALTPGLAGIPLVLGLAAWWSWRGHAPTRARVALAVGLLPAITMLVIASRSLLSPMDVPSQRWLIWSDALVTFQANPWRGVGLGQEVVGVRYLDPSGGHQWLTDAHNIWLNLAGQGGLPMTIAFAALCAWLCRCGLRAARGGDAFVSGALLAVVVAVLYDGLTGSFEDARHLWVLFGVLAGACTACGPRGTPRASPA